MKTSVLTGDPVNPDLIKELVVSLPAPKALYELKKQGVSTDILLDEAIIYYEKVLRTQQDQLDGYIKKYGA